MHPVWTRRLGACALAWALLSAEVAYSAEYYVSPSGSPSGNGSMGSPWDLQTALNQPSSVHAGDTIWLRGGTYVGGFLSNLNGTAANPIVVRQYAGERATIDGNYPGSSSQPTLMILGSYTWFWGFEIMNSDPTRFTSDGNNPPNRGEGSELAGYGTRLINMIIHDTSQGTINSAAATDSQVYGNLFYYNGYDSPDRGHGHGIYAQNQSTNYRQIYDNILFDQFGYGIHAYTEHSHIDYLDLEGNISFDNGGLSTVSGWSTNILVGGMQVALSPKLDSNYTYNSAQDGGNNIGWNAGCTNPNITNNYFDSGLALKLNGCTGVSMSSNTFYGLLEGFTESQFPGNTYYSSLPTGTKVFIRPNAYEPGRANIAVYNWDLQDTVNVDLSGFLSVGSAYEVRNAQDPFSAPVISGTYTGSPVAFPMTGMTPAAPVGRATPAATGPRFNAFILTSTLGPYEFLDVPAANPFHAAIHTLAANGVTAGCGNGDFCPDASVSRAQMAVLLLKSKHGASYEPYPATGTVFSDVPSDAFAAAWIEELAAEGVVSGCGGGRYCPAAPVTRAQMAVMVLKCSLGTQYQPPPASGDVFTDVPAGSFAADWIEDLAARGITAGCGGGHFCPSGVNTRGQMAVFLVSAFALQ